MIRSALFAVVWAQFICLALFLWAAHRNSQDAAYWERKYRDAERKRIEYRGCLEKIRDIVYERIGVGANAELYGWRDEIFFSAHLRINDLAHISCYTNKVEWGKSICPE